MTCSKDARRPFATESSPGSYRYQDAVYVAPVIFETPGTAVATTEPSVNKNTTSVELPI